MYFSVLSGSKMRTRRKMSRKTEGLPLYSLPVLLFITIKEKGPPARLPSHLSYPDSGPEASYSHTSLRQF